MAAQPPMSVVRSVLDYDVLEIMMPKLELSWYPSSFTCIVAGPWKNLICVSKTRESEMDRGLYVPRSASYPFEALSRHIRARSRIILRVLLVSCSSKCCGLDHVQSQSLNSLNEPVPVGCVQTCAESLVSHSSTPRDTLLVSAERNSPANRQGASLQLHHKQRSNGPLPARAESTRRRPRGDRAPKGTRGPSPRRRGAPSALPSGRGVIRHRTQALPRGV